MIYLHNFTANFFFRLKHRIFQSLRFTGGYLKEKHTFAEIINLPIKNEKVSVFILFGFAMRCLQNQECREKFGSGISSLYSG
jgi:hypothetical protein